MKRAPVLLGCISISASNIGVRGNNPAPEASLCLLGDFPGGFAGSLAMGVSADGNVVVGVTYSDAGVEAMRWSPDDGMTVLGDLAGGMYYAESSAVSADGLTIIGRSDSYASAAAQEWKLGFAWRAEQGMRPLNKLSYGSADLWPMASSADGSFVVGRARVPLSVEAVYWLNGGPAQPLSSLPGNPSLGFTSFADDVSLDGTVIVGQNQWPSSQGSAFHAFRWSAATGLTRIGPPGNFNQGADTRAHLVSGDGRIVYCRLAGSAVFRWTDERGSELLDFSARILDTTPDGAIIIGDGVTFLNGEYVLGQIGAYIWDECYGMRALRDWLPERFGLQITDIYSISAPRGVSQDGRTIVGTGYDVETEVYEAFVLYLPPLLEGDLDDDGVVDAIDFGILTTAMANQAAGEWFCRRADLSGDGVVNLLDVALFQRLIASPPPCPAPPPGDLDGDCTTDAHDAAFFAACMTGPSQPADAGCLPADLDADEDVDLADFVIHQRSH